MRRAFTLLALGAALAAACSGGSSKVATDDRRDGSSSGGAAGNADAASAVYPVPDWQTATPEAAGLAVGPLDEAAAELQGLGSNCFVVTRGGKVVYEQYWNGTTAESRQEIYSATKSITSTLVGIAADEGKLSLDDRASEYIPQWKGTDSEAVTVRDLLSNDSGRFWSGESDYFEMAVKAPDKTAYGIGLSQEFAPGEEWAYNNSAIQTLEAVLEAATGQDVAAYAKEKLFDPIGMGSEMTKDAAGNTLVFMGVQASCRDMARFGYLFLRDGKWDGTQIVSADYVEEATSSSTELNAGYGYLWWLNQEGHQEGALGEESDGLPWAGVPVGAYAAQGAGGQISLVIPSLDVVAVRFGPPQNLVDDNPYSQIMGAAIARAAKER